MHPKVKSPNQDFSKGHEVANIDEALDHTSFGKFNYALIILCGLVLINVVYESLGISFVLPILDCDLGISYKQQGLLSTVCFMGIIVSSLFWGFLADTTGRKHIMQPALLINFAVTILSSFSNNFETLAVLRFINGLFLSAGSATVFAYVGEFHSQRYRNRAILSAALISAFSAIFFPCVAWLSINQDWQWEMEYLGIIYKPWRFHLVACGIPGFICGLILFLMPESPKYLLSANRADEALEVLQSIHRINTNERNGYKITALLPDLDTPTRLLLKNQGKNVLVLIGSSVWQQTAPLFMRPHLKHTFLVSLIQFMLYFTAHGVYMWLPHILHSSMQYTRISEEPMRLCDILELPQNITVIVNEDVLVETKICVTNLDIGTYQHTIILEIIYFTLLLIIGYGTGKIGRKLVLFLVCLVFGICGILSVVIDIPLLAVYMFMMFLCCALGTTVVNSITVDIYPTNLRAMAVCVSLMLGRIGSVVGSNVVGLLIDHNCNEALLIAAGILLGAGILGALLPNTNERNKNNDKSTNPNSI